MVCRSYLLSICPSVCLSVVPATCFALPPSLSLILTFFLAASLLRSFFFSLPPTLAAQESVIFADQIVKLNRRNRPERRDFIITDSAFYIVARAQQNNQQFYKLTRRCALADIQGLVLSTLQDNYLVMQIPKEYDNLIENDKKSEIVAILLEYYQALTGRKLPVQFSDRYISVWCFFSLFSTPLSAFVFFIYFMFCHTSYSPGRGVGCSSSNNNNVFCSLSRSELRTRLNLATLASLFS